jgi:hypothetical protein
MKIHANRQEAIATIRAECARLGMTPEQAWYFLSGAVLLGVLHNEGNAWWRDHLIEVNLTRYPANSLGPKPDLTLAGIKQIPPQSAAAPQLTKTKPAESTARPQ